MKTVGQIGDRADGGAAARGEAIGSRTGVKFVDCFAGGREHHRFASAISVRAPGGVGLIGGGCVGGGVDAVVVGVVAQSGPFAISKGQGGRPFGGIGEADDFGQGDCTGLQRDVAEHAAGGDGRQLLVVADEPHAAPAGEDMGDRHVEVGGAGHTGFIDHQQRVRADAAVPVGARGWSYGALAEPLLRRIGAAIEVFVEQSSPSGSGSQLFLFGEPLFVAGQRHQFGQGVGWRLEFVAQHRGGSGGRRHSHYDSATCFPGAREHSHRGCLSGSRWCERHLHAAARGRQLTHQRGLPGVERAPVRGLLEKRQIDVDPLDSPAVTLAGCGHDALLGRHDGLAGEQFGVVGGVDRCAAVTAVAAQHVRFVHLSVEAGGSQGNAVSFTGCRCHDLLYRLVEQTDRKRRSEFHDRFAGT